LLYANMEMEKRPDQTPINWGWIGKNYNITLTVAYINTPPYMEESLIWHPQLIRSTSTQPHLFPVHIRPHLSRLFIQNLSIKKLLLYNIAFPFCLFVDNF
jgi:hypothetical protein